MRLPSYPIFGVSNSTAIVQSNYFGQPNFFAVPPGWAMWTDGNGVNWAGPVVNGEEKYATLVNIDGTVVFQSLIHSLYNNTLRGS